MNKALGIAGSGDSQTELLDGTVDQVLDVGQIARRGGTLAGTEGIFRCILRNVHAGAGDIFSSWQPYLPGETGLIAPYPTPVPDDLDVWLLGASVESVSGGGSLVGAALRLTQIQQGFGIDDSAAAVVSNSVFTVAWWNTHIGILAPPFMATQSLQPFKPINLRIPRKGAIASPFLSFGSQSDGINTFDCVMMMGLFPVALGQDGRF